MFDEDGLNVWFGQQLVGYLWRNDIDYIGFRYDSDWLTNNGFPISRRLPLQTEEFPVTERVAHRFFANLLPEGGAREHVVRDLRIPDTDFDLLRAIGGECAGALSVLGAESEPTSDFSYQVFSDNALLRLVSRRGQAAADLTSPTRPRLSLAGAQDKCAVLLLNERYYHPEGDAPSTHILKFELAGYRHTPLYETFTSELARAIGLPVVEIEWRSLAGKTYVQVERYDRTIIPQSPDARYQPATDDDLPTIRVERLHQEDFCQALSYSHTRKYQRYGGPDFARCVDLLREASDDPVTDVQYLLQWQVFNVLAGNSDGHAKNLSLLHRTDGTIRLAPFYDLVCTRAIDRIDSDLAFAVGEQFNPAKIRSDDWREFARRCDIGGRYIDTLVNELANRLLACINPTREAFEGVYGKAPQLQRIEEVVNQQCKRALRN